MTLKRVTVSVSLHENHYTTGFSMYVHVGVYAYVRIGQCVCVCVCVWISYVILYFNTYLHVRLSIHFISSLMSVKLTYIWFFKNNMFII